MCLLYGAKDYIVVEISKVNEPLEKKTLPLCKSGRKCKNKVLCEDISVKILPIPHWTFTCFLKTAIKALKQVVKFVQT